VQIGGPAGAFIVIVYGILQCYGLTNLLISTVLAGVLLVAMGALRLGALVRYMPVTIIIGWYSWPSLVNSWHINEYSSDPGGLIRWPVRILIPLAFTLLALQGVSEIIKRVAFLKGLIPFSTFEKKARA